MLQDCTEKLSSRELENIASFSSLWESWVRMWVISWSGPETGKLREGKEGLWTWEVPTDDYSLCFHSVAFNLEINIDRLFDCCPLKNVPYQMCYLWHPLCVLCNQLCVVTESFLAWGGWRLVTLLLMLDGPHHIRPRALPSPRSVVAGWSRLVESLAKCCVWWVKKLEWDSSQIYQHFSEFQWNIDTSCDYINIFITWRDHDHVCLKAPTLLLCLLVVLGEAQRNRPRQGNRQGQFLRNGVTRNGSRDRRGTEVYPGCSGKVCLPEAQLCAERQNKVRVWLCCVWGWRNVVMFLIEMVSPSLVWPGWLPYCQTRSSSSPLICNIST